MSGENTDTRLDNAGIEVFKNMPSNTGELLLNDEDYIETCVGLWRTYPDGMQLSGVLGSPDKPELDVLSQTFGDTGNTELHTIEFECKEEDLPGFEGLDKHEKGDTDTRDMPMAEAQIDEGVGSTGGIDIAVGHVINENEGAGPIQTDGLFVVHRHKEIGFCFCEGVRFLHPSLVYSCISIPAFVLLSILIYFLQDVA
jgi:hypothetical protein